MKKGEFNPIGISDQLDWQRIRKLLSIGMVIAKMLNVFGNHAWVNAIDCGWISDRYHRRLFL